MIPAQMLSILTALRPCSLRVLAALCFLAPLAAAAPEAAAGGACANVPAYPNDPGYAPAERGDPQATWNEEQWYLYSCLPSDAPLASDPEGASGMSVDRVWNELGTRGRNDVVVAYMEGGVNWRLADAPELRGVEIGRAHV